VFCLNADDGSLIWKGEYLAEAESSHGPGARATPFIDSNRVYTYGRSGDLVCWNLFDGEKIWHKNVKKQGGIEPEWGLSSTPLVIDNKVIVQGGGTALVIAYDKLTGELLWKSLEGASGYSASIPLIVDSVTQLLVYHATALSCLNPEDGKEIWSTPWVTDYGVNATTPAIYENIVFHTSDYGKGGQALEVTKDGFKILWTNTVIASHHSDPFIIDGYIYGYSGQSTRNKGEFKCVELKTGKEIWTTDEMGYGTGIYVDGHIICLDLKGNLFFVKPSREKFIKVTDFQKAIPELKGLAWTAPVVANGKLYLTHIA
jgi:outer membrane protein assembly factor BamB